MEREYSVNFGQYNTWSDWHLTPAERPIVVPPTEKTHNIDLPGGSGVIDAAQALTGYPVFNMREGSWDFYVENDIEPFMTIYSKVMAALQGKRLRVSLEEDGGKNYLQSDSAIALFGKIQKSVIWEDVTNRNTLKANGQRMLNKAVEMAIKITIRAFSAIDHNRR